MKLLRKFYSNLAALIIGSIVFLLIIFAILIELIGYYGFTSSFTSEYSQSAHRTAVTASTMISPENIEYYLEMGEEAMTAAEASSTGEDAKKASSFFSTRESLKMLCNTQEMSVVYVIVPDPDYKHFTCVFNCLNDNSPYTPWGLGHREEASEEYQAAYENIYVNGSEKEIVLRNSNLKEGKPHVTALCPLKDRDGAIKGIICVQRYIYELNVMRRNYLQGVGALAVILIILIIVLSSKFIRNQVVGPIRQVSSEAERFAREGSMGETKLDESAFRVNEIKTLARSIGKMEQDTVKNIENITRITKETERIGTELELAAQIQIGMLTGQKQLLSEKERFDIYASMEPAKEVGGDFYDFFLIDDTHLAILVADVSDKGIGAAFFMAISKTLIKSRAGMGGSAVDIISYTDKMISEKNSAGMFVTVWLGIIDLMTGHVDCCNAGHDYPAVKKGEQDFVIEKTPHGPPVCFLPGVPYVAYEFDLSAGDRIFLYTDGLNEAKRADGERFGLERLLNVLNEGKDLDNRELLEKMKQSVDGFVGDAPQFDDMTMLGFTFLGK